MKATELKKILDFALSHQTYSDDDFDIVVRVKEPWVGPTPAIGVKQVHIGFDWDSGRIIFEPNLDLALHNKDILKTHTLDGKAR